MASPVHRGQVWLMQRIKCIKIFAFWNVCTAADTFQNQHVSVIIFVGCPGVLDCRFALRHSHEICAWRCGGHHLPDYYIWFTVSGFQRCKLWRPPEWCRLQGGFLAAEAPICFPQQLLPRQSTCRRGAHPQRHPLLPHQCHRLVWQQKHLQRWD